MINRLKSNSIYVLVVIYLILYSSFVNAEEKIPFSDNVTMGVLDNGFKYYIRENNFPSNKVEFRLNVRSGSLNETEKELGIAHFVEHMAFNGTKNFPNNSIIKFMEEAGLVFGLDSNAYTSTDVTNYQLTIPADNKVLVEKAFAVMRDWADGITFDEKEVISERGVILEEERMRSDLRSRLAKQSKKELLKGSLYIERDPIGDRSIIKNADKSLVEGYYKKWYVPNNMSIVVVGDIKTEEAKKYIEKYFSSMKKNNTPKKADTNIPIIDGVRVNIISDKEAKGLNVTLSYFEKGVRPENYSNFKDLTLMQSSIAMLNKRITLKINEKKSNLLNFRGGVTQTNGGVRISSFNATFEKGTFDKSLIEFLTEIESVKRYGFNINELKEFKNGRITYLERAAKPDFRYESEKYAADICAYDSFGGYLTDFSQDKVLFERFFNDTNLTSFNRAFKELTSSPSVLLTVTIPESDLGKININTEIFKKIINNVSKSKITQEKYDYSDIKLIKEDVKKGEIVSQKKLKNLDAVDVLFSNGVRLIINYNKEEKNKFYAVGRKKGGSSILNDMDAMLLPVALKAVNLSGYNDVSARQLLSYMSNKQVNISLKATDYTFDIEGFGDTRDIETYFQLLYKYFTSGNINNDTLDSIIKSVKNEVSNDLKDNKKLFLREIAPKMYDSNYRKTYFLKEDISKITYDNLIKIFKDNYLDINNFVFVISSDLETDKVLELASKYISGIKKSDKKLVVKNRIVQVNNGSADGYGDTENRSEVNIFLDKSVGSYSNATYKMYPIRNILRNRLRETVREKLSGVYSISVILRYLDYPSDDFLGRISFTCDPKRKEEIIKNTMEIVEDFIEKGITKEELESARKAQILSIEKSGKENKFLSNNIALNILKNEEIISSKDIVNIVKEYDLDEINKLIQYVFKGHKTFIWSYNQKVK